MKKAIVGLGAVGAGIALRPVVRRRVVRKMREHCKQMAGHCGGCSDATGHEAIDHEGMPQRMREHCHQMAAQHEERSEPVATV